MRTSDVYWHMYRREQIKPELRGNVIYVLEVPAIPGEPVLRHLFGVSPGGVAGLDGEPAASLMEAGSSRIVFGGVSQAAAYELMLSDPPILRQDAAYLNYNRQIVTNARSFFLTRPNLETKRLPKATARLLSGLPPATRELQLESSTQD